jgi:hypothetical protein
MESVHFPAVFLLTAASGLMQTYNTQQSKLEMRCGVVSSLRPVEQTVEQTASSYSLRYSQGSYIDH